MVDIKQATADLNARACEAFRGTAKDDKGKPKLSLVPSQIIWDIAQVREYGCEKYHDPDNWRQVELQRYIDAFYRHWLKFIEDPNAIDEESGIKHYKHCACNLAFICEMMQEVNNEKRQDISNKD